MLNEKETQVILEKFFNNCVNFWKREGHEYKEAFALAIEDAKKISTNPFSPCGEKLDVGAQIQFIKYREMDLGR